VSSPFLLFRFHLDSRDVLSTSTRRISTPAFLSQWFEPLLARGIRRVRISLPFPFFSYRRRAPSASPRRATIHSAAILSRTEQGHAAILDRGITIRDGLNSTGLREKARLAIRLPTALSIAANRRRKAGLRCKLYFALSGHHNAPSPYPSDRGPPSPSPHRRRTAVKKKRGKNTTERKRERERERESIRIVDCMHHAGVSNGEYFCFRIPSTFRANVCNYKQIRGGGYRSARDFRARSRSSFRATPRVIIDGGAGRGRDEKKRRRGRILSFLLSFLAARYRHRSAIATRGAKGRPQAGAADSVGRQTHPPPRLAAADATDSLHLLAVM